MVRWGRTTALIVSLGFLLNQASCEARADAALAKAAEPARGPIAVEPATPSNPHALHDCRAHLASGPPPPLVRALSAEHRSEVTAIGIAGPTRGVNIRKTAGGWFVGGAPACSVHPDRVQGLLDHLTSLDSDPVEGLPAGIRLQVTLTVEVEGLQVLALELADASSQGDFAVLRDGSALQFHNLRREWLVSDPRLWCR